MRIFSTPWKARSASIVWALALASVSLQAGCAHIKSAGAREVAKERSTGRSISEAELKSDLQRFTQMYFDRSGEAIERMEGALPVNLRDTLLRRVLIYDSSALAIASGPVPAVNLLDMLVFTRLTRDTFEVYWGPKVFGDTGAPLLDLLRHAEADIWASAGKVLTDEQEQRIDGMIEAWKKANPDRMRVELVRFDQFSKLVGAAEVQKTASGALGSVKAMGHVADAAVLLGERAMFVGQFMPSLLRIQARLGALEIANDAVSMLGSHTELAGSAGELLGRSERLVSAMQDLTQRAEAMAPMLDQAVVLTQNLERVTQEAQTLTKAVEPMGERFAPLLESQVDAQGNHVLAIERVLRESSDLTARSLALVEQVRSLVPKSAEKQGPLDVLWGDLDRGARRLVGYLSLLGVAWATFFWGGYYLVRRRLDERASGSRKSGGSSSSHGHVGPRPSVT